MSPRAYMNISLDIVAFVTVITSAYSNKLINFFFGIQFITREIIYRTCRIFYVYIIAVSKPVKKFSEVYC